MAEFTQTVTVDCPHCESSDVIKKGKRNGYQRYQCKECDRKFDTTDRSFGRPHQAEHIGVAIDAYLSGASYQQIAEMLRRNFGLDGLSKATVYRWVQEYGDFAVDGLSAQVPQTSGHWVADEMVLKIGGQQMWNWNVMDRDTRYILASHLSPFRDEQEAVAVFEKALEANGGVEPETITTDGLGSYSAAIGLMLPDTKHIISEGIYKQNNNNLSERLQKTFRSRTKTMDGLYGQESGQKYLDRWVVDYNHFKDHEALDGQTPAEVARVDVKLEEWTDIVRDADKAKAMMTSTNETRQKPKRKPKPAQPEKKPTLGEMLGLVPPLTRDQRLAQIEESVKEYEQRERVPPPKRTGAIRGYAAGPAAGQKSPGSRQGRGRLR